MTRTELTGKLQDIIKPYVAEPELLEGLNEQTDFVKDLKINSANLVDIALDTEDAFQIEIDNEAMQRMLTVGAALDIVEEKLAGR